MWNFLNFDHNNSCYDCWFSFVDLGQSVVTNTNNIDDEVCENAILLNVNFIKFIKCLLLEFVLNYHFY